MLMKSVFRNICYSLTTSQCRKMSSFPRVLLSSDPSMFDEPVDISLQGLPPSKMITIYATTSVTKDCFYESFANYEVSDDGVVNVSKDTSLHGSYQGVEPMGLFWAMTPHASSKRQIARFLKLDVTKPQIYHFQVFDEEKSSLEECRSTKKSKSIVSTLINRWFLAPGVRRIPVRENGVVGTLFLPPGKGPFPGLISMFGGYPGVLEYKSALHASHGFASLALAYIGVENLPMSMHDHLDLEYFERSINYMKNSEHVQSDNGIGLAAICKGAQLSLIMATHLEDIRCVVSVNGHCTGGIGTTRYKGKVLDYDDFDYSKLIPNEDNALAEFANLPEPGTIEHHPNFYPFHKQHNISYMIVAGLDDKCTPSAYFSNETERVLGENKHPDFEVFNYGDTGHLIEPPYFPFCSAFFQPGYPLNTYLKTGGELTSHAKSQIDCWPKILNFLHRRLTTKPGTVFSKL